MSPEMNISVTFPGDIVEASGGQQDGRTLHWSIDTIPAAGIEARSTIDSSGPGAGSGGSVPGWIWAALGVVVVVGIGLVVLLVVRRRSSVPQGPPTHAYAGGPGDPAQQAYSAPASGYPGAAAQQQGAGFQYDYGQSGQYGQAPPGQPPQQYGQPGQPAQPQYGQPQQYGQPGPGQPPPGHPPQH